jgi:hypothetical protein
MRKTVAIWLVALSCSAVGSVCFADEETPAATETTDLQETKAPPEPAPVADKHVLFKKYVKNTLGPEGIFGAALDAGLSQWRNAPPEWGRDGKGYTQRWASAYGQSAISDTTKYAVSRLLNHDPSYQRCECTGFGPRLAHAMSSPFMARNRAGEWVLSPAVAAGITVGYLVPAATWYPYQNGMRDGLGRAGTALLSKMGVRVFREFVTLPKIFQ